jgi:uncharacterized caspase-like protein
MRRFISVLVFLYLGLTNPALADKRVALIVANGDYIGAPLENPTLDADLVAASLTNIGFAVKVVKNAELRAFDGAVTAFADTAKGADIALFYFAGHGFTVNVGVRPVNVLMSTSANVTASSDRALLAGGLPLDDIAVSLAGQAEATLVFVDACRNDPRIVSAIGGKGRGFAPLNPVQGGSLFIGLSTRFGSTARDGAAGKGSPFARAFAANVQKKGMRIDDMYRQVRDAVKAETQGAQLPDIVQDDLPNRAITLVAPVTPANTAGLIGSAPIASSTETPAPPAVAAAPAPAPPAIVAAVAPPPPALIPPLEPKPPTPALPVATLDRRVALVIGNSAYRAVQHLPNPSHDADLIGAALRSTGIEDVTIAHDLDRESTVAVLKAFARKADAADWAIIYYAGHGIEIGGTNYLIPVDAKLETDRDVPDEAISLERMQSAIEGAHKLKLIVLDACRNNPFAPQIKVTVANRSIGRGLSPVEPTGATLVVYAAKGGTSAEDGYGDDSPFALSFAKRIAEPGVEINMIFRFVRQDVLQTTGKQEPFVYGSLPPVNFYFVPPK